MRYLLFIFCLFDALSSYAQKDTVEYYQDYWGRACKPVNGYTYRRVYNEGNIRHVKDYYVKERTLRMDGTCLDDSGYTWHGMNYQYHTNGKLAEKVRYVHDTLEGLLKAYNFEGLLVDSELYKHDMPWKFSYSWNCYGKLVFKGVYDDSGSGIGEEWSYYDDGALADHGLTTTGYKKDSVWTYYYRSGGVSCKDYYKAGEKLKRECFDKDGQIQLKNCEDAEPVFIDSKEVLINKLRYRIWDRMTRRYTFEEGAWIVVNLCVSETGAMTANLVQGVKPDVDKVIIEALNGMSKATPARKFNRPTVSCEDIYISLRFFK